MFRTLDAYLAAFVLGRVRSTDLPEAAVQALAEGCDSTELAALAGSNPSRISPWELEESWKRGLRDIGKLLPTRAEAGMILRTHFAELVASGWLSPRDGAAEIVKLARDVDLEFPKGQYTGEGFGVARLLGLYYSYDDVPRNEKREQTLKEIDEDIRTECRRLARGENL